ncbi:unnamed protein product, partial [Meganyctiphanes norvegica]
SRQMLLTAVALVVCSSSRLLVQGFSFGQLFPASRSGARGSLLRLGVGSHSSGLKGQLHSAINQASAKIPQKPSVTQKKPYLTYPWLQSKVETTTPAAPVRRVSPVTNSPIFYIQLPPSPYVYMPGIGYISQPTNTGFNFLRPDINFVSNAKPHGVYSYTTKAPHPTTTTTTTTTTPRPTTTTTTTPRPPAPAKKPTNSPITWLKGPWFFNGKPNNLFLFNSAYNPGHFDNLHRQYKKPGLW